MRSSCSRRGNWHSTDSLPSPLSRREPGNRGRGRRGPEGLRRALAIKESNKSKEGRAIALGRHGG
jgi:hypothetical protein